VKSVLLILAGIFALLSGCATSQQIIDQHVRERQERLASIALGDGVNSEEAFVLSREYLWRYISGVGRPGQPVDAGEYWECDVFLKPDTPNPERPFDLSAVPLKDKIRINKKTATVSFQGKPTVSEPVKKWINNF
jgi:hypothetical protein